MTAALTVRVPATSANVGAGFDALGVALSLHLHATVAEDRGAARLVTAGEGADELAVDDTNLVWTSFAAFCAHVGAPVPDITIHVRNDIPLERGLGSSSAAIVAGLGLARAHLGAAVGDRELVAVATDLEGHPDNVAPAILGGFTVVARGDDDAFAIRRTQPPPRLRPVVLVPADRQGTTAARALLPDALPRAEVAQQAARAAIAAGVLSGVWSADAATSGDLLHEPARARAMPASGDLLAALRGERVNAWLSGAGPSVCALIALRDDPAQHVVTRLADAAGFAVHALRWDLAGLVTTRA